MTATVDGQPWTAKPGAQTLVAQLSPTGTLVIVGVEPSTSTTISIGIETLAGPDSYPLGPIPGSSAGYIEPGPPGVALSFGTTATHTGYLRLDTVDPAARRLEGTFAFGAAGAGGSPLRTITAGRLALTYRLQP